MSLVGEMVAEADATTAAAAGREGTPVEDSAEMDARVAAIMHLQQLQHKQEVMQLLEAHPVTNADTEFRVQLEELVRDHLNTCMALASCNSTHDGSSHPPPFGSLRGDTSESHHHLLEHSAEQCHHHHHHHHRYHLLVENEEIGVDEQERLAHQSSENVDSLNVPQGLLRPQTGILGRWDERQGSEPTLRERQVREAELLALSSLHTVSTLDASFLQGSPCPRTESSVERPQRLSSLFRMWRELEGERGERETNQSSERTRTRGTETEVVQMWREFDGEHEAEMQRTHDSDETRTMPLETEPVMLEPISRSHSLHSRQGSQHENSGMVESMVVEPLEDIEAFREETTNNQLQEMHDSQNEMQESDGERERVRQIVRRWMRESAVAGTDVQANVQPSNRVEWLAEGERERVRELAREWVRVSNFEARARPVERQVVHPLNLARQPLENQTRQEFSSPRDSVQTQQNHIRWDAERQRQMVLELLMRSEQERQRELEGLSEHRSVSEFAHRNRLQSLLRGRFLRNAVVTDEDRPPSSAAGEIGQLRQRRAVSGIREGFRFRLENIVLGQSNSGSNDGQRRQQANQQAVRQTNTLVARPERVGRDLEAVAAARRARELQSLEDATAYNMELRELLGRRSVTTVLASDFRDRLDQLIRSFIHRQGRTPRPWNLSRPRQPTGGTEQEQGPTQGQVEGETRANAAPFITPPPPPPPPLPLLQQEPMVHQQGWPRPGLQRTGERLTGEMEWESTSRGLRADVTVLQRGMNELREIMETSIQMQLELQRSIRQEISGALQRMYIGKEIPNEALDGSKWTSVKRGTCCICCDKQIDCLLYRCGHMCTCVKCANELHKNSGRCPMCRASIVEVVRAFTVT